MNIGGHLGAAAKQDMGRTVHRRPGVNAGCGDPQVITHTRQEIFAILVIVDDIPELDALQHDVMQRYRGIQPRASGH
jgi:hypothetical protein